MQQKKIIIGSLMFDVKVVMGVAFKKILEFSRFGYFCVEIFYIPLVDNMYDFMCNYLTLS